MGANISQHAESVSIESLPEHPDGIYMQLETPQGCTEPYRVERVTKAAHYIEVRVKGRRAARIQIGPSVHMKWFRFTEAHELTELSCNAIGYRFIRM